MQSITQLMEMGLPRGSAINMVQSYSKRIGMKSGDYVVTDVEYDVETRSRVIELTCAHCGGKICRRMRNGKNKWAELPRVCKPCTSRAKVLQRSIDEAKKTERYTGMLGDVVGDYEVVAYSPEDRRFTVKCLDCGKERQIHDNAVLNGTWTTTQCHCHNKYDPNTKYTAEYIGRKNNRLTVTGITRDGKGRKVFECKCDCGKTTLIKPTFWENGRVKSCGCLASDINKERRAKKAEADPAVERLKAIYNGMKQRCLNSKSPNYPNYGGRGITICEEWLDDRGAFISWALTHGHAMDLSIDRIDNDGNYEPGNCRWATAKTQANNQRRPKHHAPKRTIKRGDSMYSLKELCEIHGVLQATVSYRMRVKGMTLDEALNAEKCTNGRPRKDRNAEANG